MTKQNERSSRRTHGANSKQVLLWGEQQKDFDALRDSIFQEWSPVGSTEAQAVDTLVDLHWRRRRLDQYWRLKIQQQLQAISAQTRLVKDERRFEEFKLRLSVAKNVAEFRNALAWMGPPFDVLEPLTYVGAASIDWFADELKSALGRLELPKDVPEEEAFMRIINPQSIDEELRSMERIDAMIDRTIKRLVQIKSIKQILPRQQQSPEDSHPQRRITSSKQT